MWKAIPVSRTRTLRQLQLSGQDRLAAAKLATMTALRSLRAATWTCLRQ